MSLTDIAVDLTVAKRLRETKAKEVRKAVDRTLRSLGPKPRFEDVQVRLLLWLVQLSSRFL